MLYKFLKMLEAFLKSLLSKSHEAKSSLPLEEKPASNTELYKAKKWKGHKFAIIVGHEKVSPGAYAKSPLNVYEYEFNKGVASIMVKEAAAFGLDCKVFFRDGIGISGVAAAVNKWNPDCCLELHFNSATPAAIGTETLYDDFPESNKAFAALVQKNMCAALKRTGKANRGIKKLVSGDRGHYNLASVKVTGCLVEPFFGSNEKDCQLMKDSVNRYARSLVDAVLEFLHSKEGK